LASGHRGTERRLGNAEIGTLGAPVRTVV